MGAQDVHERESGAYTGEVSAAMLADCGCKYCLIGHSERRRYFGETDDRVNRKAKALHRAGIAPVVCIGETEEEREKGLTLQKLDKQVRTCFNGFSFQEMTETVVLYEPIWAIGTGRIAKPEQAEEAHRFIRNVLEMRFSKMAAFMTRIIYGGSVAWNNVSTVLKGEHIDGVGVGSNSLDVYHFMEIVKSGLNVTTNAKRQIP
jgi:triosephosphate isomerase